MEEQKVEGRKFLKVEKQRSVSPEFIVNQEAMMSKMVEGSQALDIEDDVLHAVVKADGPVPEAESAPKSTEVNTIVIDKVETVSEPMSPSPATSSLCKEGSVTGVVGQSLTVVAANPLDSMTTVAMKTWHASLSGVSPSGSSAMRAVCVVTRVGGKHRQPEAFNMKIAELDVTVEGQHASTLFPERKEHQGVEGAWAPPKDNDILSSGVEQESSPSVSVDAGAAMEEQEVEGREFSKVEK